jgi:ABC-2 type transport system permease protein
MSVLRRGSPAGTWPTLRAYARLMAVGPLVDFAYRAQSSVQLFRLVARIYLFYALWSAVYRPGQTVAGMDAQQAIAYSVLGALQAWSRGRTADSLARRVHDGSVVYLFLRPLPVQRYYLIQRLGALLESLAWLTLGTLVAWALGLVGPPPSAAVLGAYAISVLLAGLVGHYLFLLLELSAFWTLRNAGLTMLYNFLTQLLGGALVPVWFFPGWLRRLALALPFQATANIPLSLYVGRLPGTEAPRLLLEQAAWCVGLALLARVLWARAERRVVIQGG